MSAIGDSVAPRGAEALRFDAAINPYGCSPAVVAALESAARTRGYRHYGDVDAAGLRQKLAHHFGLSPENFVVYNGSGEGFVWLGLTRLMFAGRAFVCPYPSYERFVEVGRRCAAQVVEVPLTPDTWALPMPALIDAARGNDAGLVMISSPNNPTGNHLLDEDTLRVLLDALPKSLVVIDEAYAEYGGRTFAPLVARCPNLIVLKTFSKAYGLAGLRVGYVAAHERVAGELRKLQIPWAVDTLALTAAEAALGDQAYLDDIVTRVRGDVAALYAALCRLPHLHAHPTDANFVLIDLQGMTWDHLGPHLAARGIRVRRRDDMSGRIRTTSMTPDMNRILLDALASA